MIEKIIIIPPMYCRKRFLSYLCGVQGYGRETWEFGKIGWIRIGHFPKVALQNKF